MPVQWFESITGLGCSIAILTAKHGCGFTLWPTLATLPDGSPYDYSVGSEGAAVKDDVIGMFVDEAEKHGVGYGFCKSFLASLPPSLSLFTRPRLGLLCVVDALAIAVHTPLAIAVHTPTPTHPHAQTIRS